MAIAPEQKNIISILRGWQTSLAERTGLTNFAADSVIRSLTDSLAQEIVEARELMLSSYYSGQLSRAEGNQLLDLAQEAGVTPLPPATAYATAEESSVAFYVSSGTFGAINGGSAISIPAGTVIFSDEQSNELNVKVEYQTIEDVVLPALSSIEFISVRAIGAGTRYNVGREVLKNHSFTGYVASASKALKVINFYPILNGRDRESDSRFRFRIANEKFRAGPRGDSRMLLQSILVPGVIETRVLRGYYGIGTAALVVLGPEYETSNEILAAVNQQLSEIAVPGLNVTAIPAVRVSFDFELDLKLGRAISNQEKTILEADITKVMRDKLRSYSLGSYISLNSLAKEIFNTSKYLVKIGTKSDEYKTFKSVYYRKDYGSSITSEGEYLLGTDFSLSEEEFADLGVVTFSYR